MSYLSAHKNYFELGVVVQVFNLSRGLCLCELKVSLVFKETPSQKTKTKLFLNPASGMKVREM